MEWTGRQQLLFLLQSAGLGFLIGLLFEGITGIGRVCRRRWCVFVLDALFGLLAALITFFGALAIMDGQLHPLLFAGELVGFLAEHSSVGCVASRAVSTILRWCSRGLRFLLNTGDEFLQKITTVLGGILAKYKVKPKKSEKNHKIFHFFQKNS